MAKTRPGDGALGLPRYAAVPEGVHAPLLGDDRVTEQDADLTTQADVEALGQRIVVQGQVRDSDGRAVAHSLVEVWQANAAGRYRHLGDQWPAPLDPGCIAVGRPLTDALLDRVVTCSCFADEAEADGQDPVLGERETVPRA